MLSEEKPTRSHKVKNLVLDTAAFITLTHVENYAESFYTVPEVMKEVRDEKSRYFQETFPFEIKIKEPTLEALKFVTEFSKKTGDYASLSLNDIKVIALVFTLEKEIHWNVDHLRKDPVYSNQGNEKPRTARTQLPGMGAFTDDNDGWITNENVKEFISAEQGEIKDNINDDSIQVAAITTDFAIQNVMKQMLMNVISIDGLLIRSIKRWTLRCYACYKICMDVTKIFCPHCGYHSLKKVSYNIDEEGNLYYHIPNYPISLKGTKYSLPAPKMGRDRKDDLILCELQLPPVSRKQKEKSSDLTFGELERTIQSQKVVVGYKRNPNEPRKKYGKKNKSRTKRN